MRFIRGEHDRSARHGALLRVSNGAAHDCVIALAECDRRYAKQKEKDSSPHRFSPHYEDTSTVRACSAHPDAVHRLALVTGWVPRKEIRVIKQQANITGNTAKGLAAR
jgi:hypothetical protein